MFSVPRCTGLADQAYEKIRHAVIGGELSPGDPVIEARIADQLNMSRTPVREALQTLARDGLLEAVPARGYFVPRRSADDVGELFELREALEGMAARGAAQRATSTEIDQLEELCRTYASSSSSEEWVRLGTEFHAKIAEAARNRRLAGALNTLKAQIVITRRSELREVRGRQEEARREHEAILAAIAARNEDSAEQHAREHVRRSHAAWLRRFEVGP
jgi:DNA-binding GntR family transcriptional regulator